MGTEIGRIRRFTLGMAVILISWSVAGLSVDQSAQISAFGLALRIAKPNLLPIGVALAVIYGALRYYYYAIMLSTSPFRKRRDLLDQLRGETTTLGPAPKPAMYFGASDLESTPWRDDFQEIDALGDEIKAAFPKFARARVTYERIGQTGVDADNPDLAFYALKMHVPVRCRIAALAQDIDYSSPVWFSVVALGSWTWALVHQ